MLRQVLVNFNPIRSKNVPFGDDQGVKLLVGEIEESRVVPHEWQCKTFDPATPSV